MSIEHKMSEAYLKHKVFDDLKYMKKFYDSISMSCFSFVATGTHGITNYASYVYASLILPLFNRIVMESRVPSIA